MYTIKHYMIDMDLSSALVRICLIFLIENINWLYVQDQMNYLL